MTTINTEERGYIKQYINIVTGDNTDDDVFIEKVSKLEGYKMWRAGIVVQKAIKEIRQTIRENINSFLILLVVGMLAVLAVKLVVYSVDKSHKIYCQNLHNQAEKYALWYATEAEREMCKSLDMELPPDNTAHPDGQPWPYYKN